MTQLSLSWDAHQKNICNGLSALQQRGEFVDMTLAADGHHVKVHQLVLSLVSPYIKELIVSAQCPHPVIFLNNISYPTLCAILEYIYTGEVHVAKDKLADLIVAGKALHIKGLREMDEEETQQSIESDTEIISCQTEKPSNTSQNSKCLIEQLREYKEKKKKLKSKQESRKSALPICKIFVDKDNDESDNNNDDVSMEVTEENSDNTNSIHDANGAVETVHTIEDIKSVTIENDPKNTILNPKIRFTLSNQGGLQVVFNRYIYHLRYYSKKSKVRLWRCIDYSSNLKCPANIFTNENNEVTSRSFTHNHPFHDKKIIKKHNLGIIYTGFQEANDVAESKKNQRRVPCSSAEENMDNDDE